MEKIVCSFCGCEQTKEGQILKAGTLPPAAPAKQPAAKKKPSQGKSKPQKTAAPAKPAPAADDDKSMWD